MCSPLLTKITYLLSTVGSVEGKAGWKKSWVVGSIDLREGDTLGSSVVRVCDPGMLQQTLGSNQVLSIEVLEDASQVGG